MWAQKEERAGWIKLNECDTLLVFVTKCYLNNQFKENYMRGAG
jgi:hypothetical protein